MIHVYRNFRRFIGTPFCKAFMTALLWFVPIVYSFCETEAHVVSLSIMPVFPKLFPFEEPYAGYAIENVL